MEITIKSYRKTPQTFVQSVFHLWFVRGKKLSEPSGDLPSGSWRRGFSFPLLDDTMLPQILLTFTDIFRNFKMSQSLSVDSEYLTFRKSHLFRNLPPVKPFYVPVEQNVRLIPALHSLDLPHNLLIRLNPLIPLIYQLVDHLIQLCGVSRKISLSSASVRHPVIRLHGRV